MGQERAHAHGLRRRSNPPLLPCTPWRELWHSNKHTAVSFWAKRAPPCRGSKRSPRQPEKERQQQRRDGEEIKAYLALAEAHGALVQVVAEELHHALLVGSESAHLTSDLAGDGPALALELWVERERQERGRERRGSRHWGRERSAAVLVSLELLWRGRTYSLPAGGAGTGGAAGDRVSLVQSNCDGSLGHCVCSKTTMRVKNKSTCSTMRMRCRARRKRESPRVVKVGKPME